MDLLQTKFIEDLAISVMGYFTAKEHNVKIKSLLKLYEKETEILNELERSVENIFDIPDESYLLLLKKRLQTIREHIKVLEK